MGRAVLFRLLRSRSNNFLSPTAYSSGSHLFRSGTSANRQALTRPTIASFFHTNNSQKRWSSAVKEEEEKDGKISIGPQKRKGDDDHGDEKDLVYTGPISSTIRKVKILSLSTCCMSVSLGPVVTFMTLPGVDVIVKGATASIVMILSASTTAALHWFVSPYIHKLRWRPGSDEFEAETMTWLASPSRRTIKFADIRRAETQRPYVTFMAGNEFYYVDPEQCRNKALLAKLTPREPAHPSAFKNL